MKYIFAFLALLYVSYSINPIHPPGTYFADPSARLIDNKIYLYGSTDESCKYYCSYKHDVLHSSDIENWELTENIFLSKSEIDNVTYNNSLLFAPDLISYKGNFYLFYCQPDKKNSEGISIGRSPLGPFQDGKPIDIPDSIDQIDPAIFIDDDNQVYYLWGQFSLKMSKFDLETQTIDFTSLQDSIVTEKEHFFHEGAYLTKRDSVYYLIYSDISREDKPTCIGYATSGNIYGPYEYQGVIIDNDGCNPGNWNNHGSIAEFNNQWYVFYHRSTHACKTMRKTCAEPIYFDENGKIAEVEMTTQGTSQPLNPKSVTEAEYACLLHGNVRIEQISSENEILTNFNRSDAAIYKYFNFSVNINEIVIKANVRKDCKILISAGKPWEHRLALIDVKADNYTNDEIIRNDINFIEGVHALWIQVYSDYENPIDIDNFYFE